VDIERAGSDNRYGKGTGTSDSAAIVAGVVALIRSKFPALSATEVIHRLTATATDKGPKGRDPEYGYGIVNPYAALTADVPPPSATASPAADASPSPSGVSQGPPSKASGKAPLAIIGALAAVAVVVAVIVIGASVRRRGT